MQRTQFENKRRGTLRKETEAQLSSAPVVDFPARSSEELLHELHVHQVELEMQNEELRRAYVALEESRDRFVDLYEFAPVGYLTLTREGAIAEINLTGVALLGVARKKLLHRRFAKFIAHEDNDRWHRHFLHVLQHGEKQSCDLALNRPDGTVFHARLDCLYTATGATSAVRVALTDITESKRLEDELVAVKCQLQATLDAIPDLLFEVGADGAILDYHPSRTELMAAHPEALLGKTLSEALPPGVAEVCELAISQAKDKGYSIGKQYELQLPHGKYWFEISVSRKPFDAVQQPHFLFLVRDITERKQAEEQIHDMAFYDALTGLPNRSLLKNRMDQAMAASNRSGRYNALLFLDLDNFKPLNDVYGHDVGDALLVEVARRINSCVREVDAVARFGGDEFMVMLSELSVNKAESATLAGIVAEKIRAILAKPYALKVKQSGNKELTIEHHCTASIGVQLFINHEVGAKEIVKCADLAMYQAKEAGRNQVRFYEPKV